MADAVAEMVDWCNNNPNDEDLVVMYLWDCEGDNCLDMSLTTLRNAGVVGIVQDCLTLRGMTVGMALNISKLENGGHLLVLFNCGVNQEYWEENTCSGYLNSPLVNTTLYTCYNTSDTKWFPLSRMFAYLFDISHIPPPENGYLYENQVCRGKSTFCFLPSSLSTY
jgi:hypothetical protein